jgi:hypothetical protein
MRLKDYINEENKGLGLTFFDLDETLLNTFAQIKIIKDGDVVRKLTNSEYNSYKLKSGESFDFSEFKDAKLFYDTSKPIYNMIKTMSDIVKKTENRNSKVIILTARDNLDDKELFLSKLRKEGIPVDKSYVERAGTRAGFDIKLIKKTIISEYLSSGLYRRVRIFDDFLETCKEFLKLKDDISDEILNKICEVYGIDRDSDDIIKFSAYYVQPDGTFKEVR